MAEILSKPKEILELFFVGTLVRARNLVENCKVFVRYYRNFQFFKIDFLMFLLYFFRGPFHISKCFLLDKGEEDIYDYGETPLTTLENIAKESECSSSDTLFELGCGRGKTAFWLNCFTGCKVVGIEIIPTFIEKARFIKSWFKVDGVEFRNEDILSTDYSGATMLYLYGTTMEKETIVALIEKFKSLPKGTKIMTVSFPLSDYTAEALFRTEKIFTVTFNWGDSNVFLQTKL
ncbi:MAG: SAM-dependent methyltransferase [Chlamydiales bacterium]|jgi:SAM-dependent methyltransferase